MWNEQPKNPLAEALKKSFGTRDTAADQRLQELLRALERAEQPEHQRRA